jgi:hypothetical protein
MRSACGNNEPEKHCEFAEAAADSAVRKVFAILGVDVDKPEDHALAERLLAAQA